MSLSVDNVTTMHCFSKGKHLNSKYKFSISSYYLKSILEMIVWLSNAYLNSV